MELVEFETVAEICFLIEVIGALMTVSSEALSSFNVGSDVLRAWRDCKIEDGKVTLEREESAGMGSGDIWTLQ